MVTADEIASIEIFAASERPRAARPRLGRHRLTAGEYAAPEGGERALFGVLEGRIEAVKLVDGIERVVGERRPGDIFGEVPIALGTVFPVGFRAAETSRVMRIEPHDYHSVAAVAPDVAQGGRPARRSPDERAGAGSKGSRPSRRRRGRSSSGIAGTRLHRAPPFPRPQPDHVRLGPARGANAPASGAARCRPRATAR